MLKHRALVAEFLQTNYDKFFKHYADLLQTKNYATLRQALKLLSELLLGSLGFSMKEFSSYFQDYFVNHCVGGCLILKNLS